MIAGHDGTHGVPATQETLREVSLSNIVKVYPPPKKKSRTSKMARLKVLNTKPDDLSLIPRAHTVEGETNSRTLSSDLNTCTCMSTHAC